MVAWVGIHFSLDTLTASAQSKWLSCSLTGRPVGEQRRTAQCRFEESQGRKYEKAGRTVGPVMLFLQERITKAYCPAQAMAIDVSVIIPTFRRELQLLEAIGSVLGQSGVSLEIIVVDDSPEGSARTAVASIPDSRVRYVLADVPSNGFPALPRNQGAALAQGRFLYFLDDDDILKEDTLRVMSEALDGAPHAGMAFGVVEPFGTDEGSLRHNKEYFARARKLALRLQHHRDLSASLVFNTTILVNSACMGRREAFLAAGGYDAEIPVCEDTDLWARIAHTSGHVFLDRPVVRYRTGAPSLMHNLKANDEKLDISYRRIQAKYRERQGPLKFLARKVWARALFR
jgi:glycosyltransferase involved in cell wall biosynthesis